jgi:hypothetical protein
MQLVEWKYCRDGCAKAVRLRGPKEGPVTCKVIQPGAQTDRAQLCRPAPREGQSCIRSVGGRVHARHTARVAKTATVNLTEEALGERPGRRDKFAVAMPACRAGISIQARRVANRLDGRHQVHSVVAATAGNSGLDHGGCPTRRER